MGSPRCGWPGAFWSRLVLFSQYLSKNILPHSTNNFDDNLHPKGRSTGADPTTDSMNLGCLQKSGVWVKVEKKASKKVGLVSYPQQVVVHPSLSGSTSPTDLGSGCFSPGLDRVPQWSIG